MNVTWRLFGLYLMVIVFILLCEAAFGQNICKKDICVVEFNASWNESNSVDYLDELTDCGIKRISIDKGDWQKDYNIVVVPTIIIFNGEEVERFQADIRFTIQTKLEEIQAVVDDIIMSDF